MDKELPEAERQSTGPKGASADVRGALLAAGQRLHEERGLDHVSLREVAERAGVNQAMVRYYFGDRNGFLAAMLDDGFDRLFAAVPETGSARKVLERWMSELNGMPWLMVLMMQCVYASTELRAHFVQRHAPRIVAIVGRAVQPRSDGDARLAVLSFVSMLVFPQLARPIVEEVFKLRFDERFARDFASQIADLFNPEGESNG
jgi:TetR/AcrR family transcriptional regulator